MTDFRVGDEVVCVDAGLHPQSDALPDHICEGSTYVVRSVGPSPAKNEQAGCIVVFLVGIENRGSVSGLDMGYWPFRFRKVIRRDLQAWLATAVPAPHLDKRRVRA